MTEQRKEIRLTLSIPVKVLGHTPSGEPWEEMTASNDTSYNGAAFPLQHKPERGQVMLLACPLPKGFRSYDLNEPSYRVWALVRSVKPMPEGNVWHVGVLFLGKNPPRGHEKRPGQRYLLPTDAPEQRDRRGDERRTAFVNLRITRLVAEGGPGAQEITVAENVSRGGARVPTAMPVTRGEVLMVEELGGTFRTRAEVRNVFLGNGNITRLNLQFIDGQAPDRLVQ